VAAVILFAKRRKEHRMMQEALAWGSEIGSIRDNEPAQGTLVYQGYGPSNYASFDPRSVRFVDTDQSDRSDYVEPPTATKFAKTDQKSVVTYSELPAAPLPANRSK
jgi:hypothetical protein